MRTTNSPENHREEVTVKVETADRTARRRIATTDSYAEAEAVVDRLADDGFPVEHVSIVGRDLEYVEQVIGHVNAWKAALSGAASGLLFGCCSGCCSAPGSPTTARRCWRSWRTGPASVPSSAR